MENNIFRLMPGPVNEEKKIVSKHIKWCEVVKMRNYYMNHPGAPKVPTAGGPMTLKGLTVSRDSLNDILTDTAVNEVMILFAVRHEDMLKLESGDIGAAEYNKQFFTTVVVGMKNGQAQTEKAHDYCEPCPSKCGNL